jgi:uncharacterized protein (TIGR00159 family)
MFTALQDLVSIHGTLDLLLMVVDFVVVYVLIYQVLVLIRGTRAVSVLVGLLFLIVFYFISKDEYLGLSTLQWLLDKFIGSFILVVVVLFQQDIRRALSSFAKTRLFSGLTPQQGAQLVEELVRACNTLSRHRVGALIAVEREGDLTQYADEGVHLDAAITNELLFAIFNPDNANPLHDGAVVVRGDRIAAAGAFLPLTSNPRVDKTLGTRHRAAIGLTEDTDAVVLIVSEETGIISVALGGKLSRNLDANALRQVLHVVLGTRVADGRARRGKSATGNVEVAE